MSNDPAITNEQKVDALLDRVTPLEHKPIKDRFTYVTSLVHEHEGDEAKGVQRCGYFFLDTKEELYSRRIVVTPVPQKLPLGHFYDKVSGIGFVCIQNLHSIDRIGPAVMDWSTALLNAVCIAYDGFPEGMLALPGVPQILVPTDHSSIILYSLSSDIECRVTIYPR